MNADLPHWYADALCAKEQADPEIFFPEHGRTVGNELVLLAKSYCRRCPVATECYQEGSWEWGIWGGLTATERRYLSRRTKRYSTTICNLKGCDNPITQINKGGRRLYCSKLHQERASRINKQIQLNAKNRKVTK